MSTKKDKSRVFKRFAAKGVFPFQLAFTLLIPLRNIFLSPKKLVARLELKNSFKVLEVGSGPGYFSPKVAETLSCGELILADIQQEMLDMAKKRLTRKGLSNVEFYLCDGLTFNLEDNFFDRIFLVTVIGEVENRDSYMREFYRMLKPGGLLSISEMAGDPDKMTVNQVRKLATDAGFEFYRLYGREKNYTLNFKKP